MLITSSHKVLTPLSTLRCNFSSFQLVIAYNMNAGSMGEFTKSEFSEGMLKMGVDNLDKLKKKLPDLRAELSNPDRFHDVYNYAYMFSREVRLQQRMLLHQCCVHCCLHVYCV